MWSVLRDLLTVVDRFIHANIVCYVLCVGLDLFRLCKLPPFVIIPLHIHLVSLHLLSAEVLLLMRVFQFQNLRLWDVCTSIVVQHPHIASSSLDELATQIPQI